MKAITAVSEFRAALDSLGVISSVKGWIDGLKSSLDAAGSSLGRVSLGAAAVAAGMIALQVAGRLSSRPWTRGASRPTGTRKRSTR